MIEYVAGLLYNEAGDYVALIEKQKPEWQKGKLNAIGGKVEPGENPQDAMQREFLEETGVDIAAWQYRFTLEREGVYAVHFFSHYSSLIHDVKTIEEEKVGVYATFLLPINLIPNLKWIIPILNDHTIEIPKKIYDIAGN